MRLFLGIHFCSVAAHIVERRELFFRNLMFLFCFVEIIVVQFRNDPHDDSVNHIFTSLLFFLKMHLINYI